ncbi:MAG: GNAT family N-acetyltransferase [Terriglobia bacterium]
MIIRQEGPDDAADIRSLNLKAFGQPAEAAIVDKLRRDCRELLSLVAVEGGRTVGHILFSPVTVAGDGKVVTGMGLAPMAVLPSMQRQGIGTRLVRAGIERLEQSGYPFVIVLGHPGYYPRFGFEPASAYSLGCQWEGVPGEAFMILWLDKSMAERVSGVVRFRQEFDEAM